MLGTFEKSKTDVRGCVDYNRTAPAVKEDL
jgi:hypothetical protein